LRGNRLHHVDHGDLRVGVVGEIDDPSEIVRREDELSGFTEADGYVSVEGAVELLRDLVDEAGGM
jgi:hypothetical protein